jgi:hypothetical protein
MAKIDFEDQANFNRLNVIVFNRPLENVDKSVLEKLMTDAEEREAIFAWIVDGAYEWREHGLQRPAEVNAATKEYQRTMNPLTWFIDGHCEKKDGVKIGASELHKRFKSIAETMPREFQRTIQAEMLSVANFGRTMKKLGFVSKHTESGSVYEGLTISDTWEEIEYEIDPYMEQIVRPDRADGYEANLDKTHVENLSAYRSLRKTLSNPSALSAELPTANLWDLDAPPDSLSDVQIEPHPTRIIRQADFEGYVREKLEGLADGDLKGSFAPELLCKITVADYCDEHEISGDDRKSRINLSRHFSELVNGKSSAASIFLNLTGGRPLLLAGNRS